MATRTAPLLLLALLPPVSAQATRPAPPATPVELWARLEAELPPFAFAVRSDRVVPALTHPAARLRRVEIEFAHQVVLGRTLESRGVVFLPVEPPRHEEPARRGKVVIVGAYAGPWWDSFLCNYGEPIALQTGYPTMVLEVPGHDREEPERGEWSIRPLIEHAERSQDPYYHHFFRLAVPFLRGVDVFAGLLGLPRGRIRAVIGGHSKRATAAYTAAAIWPERFAGVVYCGNENVFDRRIGTPLEATSPWSAQRFVACPCFYLGATNEGGYAMFNVNRFLARMERPWTVAIVPNHRHAPESEQMYLCWPMWVAHVFDGRPLARIEGLEAEPAGRGTRFRARIATPNRVLLANLWYVYNDDEPYWRDLTWYPVPMRRGEGDLYEAYVHGRAPDAWYVEVLETGQGLRGYVSSLPRNLTGKAAATRPSETDGRGRLWRPK